MQNERKKVIIIGAGPAGLTAAYELLEKTDMIPVIYEETNIIGGISRTVDYKGNKIDIGGHRFFSKFDRIMNWWANILPFQASSQDDSEKTDNIMLIRNRVSRIFFLGKFFDYPISLNFKTMLNLGIFRIFKMGASYLKIKVFPIKNEKNLEDFFINRFGKELYSTFFKDYTEKVWGIPCNQINADWGAQRVKGLSISKAVLHFLLKPLKKATSVNQKNVETSLISQFLYPKYGPGQLWEQVAEIIKQKGGEIHLNHKAIGLKIENNRISEVVFENTSSCEKISAKADHYISTMPVKDLINSLEYDIPQEVQEVANGLLYRDFITVGLLLDKLKLQNGSNLIPDNWMYIQEKNVKLGRLQIFNNWSPYMVTDLSKVWLGLEYFCNEGDALWNMEEAEFIDFTIDELSKIGVVDKKDVIDATRIRFKKAYPAYFGTYNRFDTVKEFLNRFENLYLIGRNGMHRYNNMDHSMLTAITAVENIINNVKTKDNIWNINTEKQYHENKLTAVENLTGDVEKLSYNPAEYWEKTENAYAYYPTVKHRKRFILNSLKNFKFKENTFVFDYGCGEGGVLSGIREKFNLTSQQIGGFDVAENVITKLKEKFDSPNFYHEKLPVLNKKCGVIICSEVIEHTEKYSDIIKWIHDNLDDNGILILTTQSGKIHASDIYTGHTQHFNIKELELLLKDEGFRIQKSFLWGFPLFTLQKYLTNINFKAVQKNYLEGELSLRKKIVFDVTYFFYFIHDLIKAGPQIYIIASKDSRCHCEEVQSTDAAI